MKVRLAGPSTACTSDWIAASTRTGHAWSALA
jgi:hypothetical protein